MTEKIIALVDYENVGTLENITLARYERLLFFTGAQQDFIRLPAVTQAGNITVSVLQAPGVSKNNVDFHLVLELGRLSVSESADVGFHVISNDKGYDGVIARLAHTGRRCCRIPASPPAETVNAPPDAISHAEVQRVVAKIKSLCRQSVKNRPASPKSLCNYIRSLVGAQAGMVTINQVRDELIRQHIIAVYEKTVVWKV